MKLDPKGEGVKNVRELAPWQNIAEDTEAGFAYLKVLPDVRSDRQDWSGSVGVAR